VHLEVAGCTISVHNTHIPPGASNAWIKIQTLNGLFKGLSVRSDIPRILCGDFNTPQAETPDGRVVTWAQRLTGSGDWRVARSIRGGPGSVWDEGERRILTGLAVFDLVDVYRSLHGYTRAEASWLMRRGEASVGRRFDHVFASRDLRPNACQYLHTLRERGLSDHSPIEADFVIDAERVL
jgi:exonuclease III